jgi:hypothetical protein
MSTLIDLTKSVSSSLPRIPPMKVPIDVIIVTAPLEFKAENPLNRYSFKLNIFNVRFDLSWIGLGGTSSPEKVPFPVELNMEVPEVMVATISRVLV